MSLNQSQSRAIAHNRGPCMVLAGPGSGKTLVITKRIEYLMKHHKVRPEEILVITFTKATAKEMKMRFYREMEGAAPPVTFGTFHGIYYGILKWAYGFGPQNLFSDEEKYQLLRQVIGRISKKPEFEGMLEAEAEDEKEFIQSVSGEIGCVKNNLLIPEEYHSKSCRDSLFAEIYREYEQQRKRMKKIDFDDMLVLCRQLFVTRPDILKKWQERYRYILIDEFQDINKVQYDVIKMLAAPEDNLFIVGDDDQSIYRFRGAKPEIMLGFEAEYPKAKKIVLNVNYRSTKAIVNSAERVIAHNEKRYPKEIITTNEQGDTVHIQEVRDPKEESLYLLKQLKEAERQGIALEETAVLFRTNADVRTVMETLMEYGIAFRMKERLPNLYEHFISRDLCAYLRMAGGSRVRRDFLQVMNRPKRYIARDCLEKSDVSFEELRTCYCDKEWMQDRIDQFELDLRMMERMTPYAAIQYIRKKIGYEEFLDEYAQFRKMNAEDLKEVLKEIQESAKPYKTTEEWFAHIEEYTEELKRQAGMKEEQSTGVALMTMHGAKGLEFDLVFIIGANETVIPYKKAKLPEELEEERRMFYVAMTRARKKLIISYTKEKNGKEMSPSRFVNELLLS